MKNLSGPKAQAEAGIEKLYKKSNPRRGEKRRNEA
jgi:hypothetical protein